MARGAPMREGFSLKKGFLRRDARLPAQDYLEPEAAREKRKTAHAMKRLRIPMTTNCQEGGMTSIMAY